MSPGWTPDTIRKKFIQLTLTGNVFTTVYLHDFVAHLYRLPQSQMTTFTNRLIYNCITYKQVFIILSWFSCYGFGASYKTTIFDKLIDTKKDGLKYSRQVDMTFQTNNFNTFDDL